MKETPELQVFLDMLREKSRLEHKAEEKVKLSRIITLIEDLQREPLPNTVEDSVANLEIIAQRVAEALLLEPLTPEQLYQIRIIGQDYFTNKDIDEEGVVEDFNRVFMGNL